MNQLFFALAIICVVEGVMLALFPQFVKDLADKLSEIPIFELRVMGAIALGVGVVIFYFIGP